MLIVFKFIREQAVVITAHPRYLFVATSGETFGTDKTMFNERRRGQSDVS